MFTFKLLQSTLRSTVLNQRQISGSSRSLLGFSKGETKEDETTIDVIDFEEEDPEERQQRIDRIRNKSRLLNQHRNILHNIAPYKQSESWVHDTIKYKRKIYAKYGSESRVDPRICFWTKSEIEEREEYERVAFPKTVPEMMAINQEEKRAKQENILRRDVEVAKNLEKLGTWMKDIQQRKEKKENDARVAKERKDRLIDEVRRHFGYTIDPRDDRFKELLELKEKEQRKAMKETKRQDKESKLMEKLLNDKKNKVDFQEDKSQKADEEEKKP